MRDRIYDVKLSGKEIRILLDLLNETIYHGKLPSETEVNLQTIIRELVQAVVYA
jgi:hypothetical protein